MSTETDTLSDDVGSRARYSRHDILLLAMPTPLLGGATLGTVGSISLTLGLWIGCLLTLPLLVYVLFVDPPL